MHHRSFVRSRRRATALAFCVVLLCAGCTSPAPSAMTPVPASTTVADTTASAPPTAAPPSPTLPAATSPPAPTATVAQPTMTPTIAATTAPTVAPLVVQTIQPLGDETIVDTPMRGVEAITDGSRPYRIAAWSPRGGYAAATPQDGPGIDVIDLATGDVTPLVTTTYVLEPRWTADGRLIIHQVEDGRDTLRLYDPEADTMSEPLVTTDALSAPDIKGEQAVFTRAGEVVVCTSPCADAERALAGGALMAAFAPGSSPLVAYNPIVRDLEAVQTMIVTEGGEPQPVSVAGEGLWLPRWSPDATRLALTSIEGRIVVVDITTGVRVDLGPGDAPAWSPDGTLIAFAGTSAGLDYTTRDIHIVRADGTGARQRLTDANEEQFFLSPSWSPDGRQVLFVEIDSGQVFVGNVPGVGE